MVSRFFRTPVCVSRSKGVDLYYRARKSSKIEQNSSNKKQPAFVVEAGYWPKKKSTLRKSFIRVNQSILLSYLLIKYSLNVLFSP